METKELETHYKIDKDRLSSYLERIQNQYSGLSQTQILAKFLHNQSIVNSEQFVTVVLEYFNDKISEKCSLSNFTFEWIRAKTIRSEYRKNLNQAQYPKLEVAVDDSIFLFFVEYDKYIRLLLKPEIKEYEISFLYEVFFSPPETEILDIEECLIKHKMQVPTVFKESKRVDTSIMTLRASLSQLIENDYKSRSPAVSEESAIKNADAKSVSKPLNGAKREEFSGPALERLIKNYCFSKKQAATQEILSACTQFLSSYFKFGTFYRFDDIKEYLIESLVEYLYAGLTEKYKSAISIVNIKNLVSKVIVDFRNINQITVLDGLAWINDLKSVLKKVLENFFEMLESPIPDNITKEQLNPKANESSTPQNSDFSAMFDLTLEVDEYRKQLEYTLSESKITSVEKNLLIRSKVQEFQSQKRRALIKK